GSSPGRAPCTPAQLGVSLCPCAGTVSREAYAEVVELARIGLCDDPNRLLEPLRRRMDELAAAERFEEAADARDRAAALAGALRQQRRLEALRRAEHLVVEVPGHGGAELARGRLVRAWPASTTDSDRLRFDAAPHPAARPAGAGGEAIDGGAASAPA